MKTLPDWEWATILTLHAVFGAIVGFLSGLLKGNFLSIIFQPFMSLLSALIIGITGAALFYYFILFYLNRKTDIQKLYTMVAIATLPMLALRIISFIGPPVDLIGFAITCLLCTVGLVENFAIERKLAVKIMAGIFSLFVVIWVVGIITSSRNKVELRQEVTPETLDILEKEMQGK